LYICLYFFREERIGARHVWKGSPMEELKFGERDERVVHKKLEKGDLSDEYIFDMAQKIVARSNEKGILLRLLGATAFLYHCPKHREMYKKLERRLTDVDVVTYSRFKSTAIESALGEIGLKKQRHYVWHAESREIYFNEEGLFVDVFRDTLNFSHEVSFRGRLELDDPTITVEDMLLEKLQIHDITEKDFKDVVILLLEHDFGERDDRERIDTSYIADVLADDWGFWYDAVNNLKRISDYADQFELIGKGERTGVKNRISRLVGVIDEAPKTGKWERRAKKGTKKKWYNDVGEIQQGV
jgi:hypothetical protein